MPDRPSLKMNKPDGLLAQLLDAIHECNKIKREAARVIVEATPPAPHVPLIASTCNCVECRRGGNTRRILRNSTTKRMWCSPEYVAMQQRNKDEREKQIAALFAPDIKDTIDDLHE